jgi:hypothetical protein
LRQSSYVPGLSFLTVSSACIDLLLSVYRADAMLTSEAHDRQQVLLRQTEAAVVGLVRIARDRSTISART